MLSLSRSPWSSSPNSALSAIALVSPLNSLSMSTEAPGLPARQHGLGELGHDRGVGLNPRFQEGRLDQAPLAQPEVAFARHQAVAQHRFEDARAEVLDVVARVGDEDLLDEIGVADKEQPVATDAEARHGAIAAGELEEEVDTARPDLAEVAADQRPPRARGQAGPGDNLFEHATILPEAASGVDGYAGRPDSTALREECRSAARLWHAQRWL